MKTLRNLNSYVFLDVTQCRLVYIADVSEEQCLIRVKQFKKTILVLLYLRNVGALT